MNYFIFLMIALAMATNTVQAKPSKKLAKILGSNTVLCTVDPDPKVNDALTLKYYKDATLLLRSDKRGRAVITTDAFGFGSDTVYDSYVGEFLFVNFGDDGRDLLIVNVEDLKNIATETPIAADLVSYGHWRPEVGVPTGIIRVNCKL